MCIWYKRYKRIYNAQLDAHHLKQKWFIDRSLGIKWNSAILNWSQQKKLDDLRSFVAEYGWPFTGLGEEYIGHSLVSGQTCGDSL